MKEIITAIAENGKFKENKILKPHLTDRLGLRMIFPEGAQCILWTNGKKYYARCEAFGALFTLAVPQKIGDEIWQKFKTQYEGNYSYEDI
jgi:hypothetical protein